MTSETTESGAKAEGSYGRFEILVKSTQANTVDYVWIIERNKRLPPICVELEPGEKLTRQVLIEEDNRNLKYGREIGSDIGKVLETANNLLDRMHEDYYYPYRRHLKQLKIKQIPL